MDKVLILFGPPVDAAAFARYFEETHRPLLDRLPQLGAIEAHWVTGAVTGDLAVHLLVELCFASEQARKTGSIPMPDRRWPATTPASPRAASRFC